MTRTKLDLHPICCKKLIEYKGDIAAPGYGQSWGCSTCGTAYIKLRGIFSKMSNIEPEDYIMTPGEVI